jgi:hypothetical protein
MLRVESFAGFLVDCAKNTAGVSRVQTLQEAGDVEHPYGVAVHIGAVEVRWQVTGRLAPGERHDSPAAEVEGKPCAWQDTAVQDGGEEWLAALIGRSGSPRIARIERWSVRVESRPGHVGVTVFFHNGACVFVRFLGCVTGGRR